MTDIIELAGNLIVDDRQILLLYREDEEHWEVPGGKVEGGESPTEAAVREAKEEIGVDVELEKPFYSGEFQHDGQMFLWHGYVARIEEEPSLQEDRFSEMKWFYSTQLENIDLAPNLEMILPALRKI